MRYIHFAPSHSHSPVADIHSRFLYLRQLKHSLKMSRANHGVISAS